MKVSDVNTSDYYDCVGFRVRAILYQHLGNMSPIATRIYGEWRALFFQMFEYVSTDFVVLKQRSVNFIVDQLVNSMPSLPAVPLSDDE